MLLEVIIFLHLLLLTCHSAKRTMFLNPCVIPDIATGTTRTIIFYAVLLRWSYPWAHICVESKGVGERNEANRI